MILLSDLKHQGKIDLYTDISPYFSNPKVQVFMLDNGVMPVLLRMLSTKGSTTLRNRLLYALSSLLRHFPYAQQNFLQQGGLEALSTVFQQGGTEKLQLKAVTLVNDLLIEKVRKSQICVLSMVISRTSYTISLKKKQTQQLT